MMNLKVKKKNQHRKMMSLFKKALAQFKKIELNGSISSIDASTSFSSDGFIFRVTVFGLLDDNVTFNFYDFMEIKDIKRDLDELIKTLKSNDFKLVSELL